MDMLRVDVGGGGCDDGDDGGVNGLVGDDGALVVGDGSLVVRDVDNGSLLLGTLRPMLRSGSRSGSSCSSSASAPDSLTNRPHTGGGVPAPAPACVVVDAEEDPEDSPHARLLSACIERRDDDTLEQERSGAQRCWYDRAMGKESGCCWCPTEAAGALGDLGTFIPLFIGMAMTAAIKPTVTLFVTGVHSVVSGRVMGRPLAVQPMKAIAAVAIAHGLNRAEVAAAGAIVATIVGILAATGLLKWAAKACPAAIVRGVQAGLGLALANKGLALAYEGCWTTTEAEKSSARTLADVRWIGGDGVVVALLTVAAVTLLDKGGTVERPRIPPALVIFPIGLIVAIVRWALGDGASSSYVGDAGPFFVFPSAEEWKAGAWNGAIPQLPLTVLNSVLAVCALADELYGTTASHDATTAAPARVEEHIVAFSITLGNLAGFTLGSMPVCHGAGGLMAQHRFGARTGVAPMLLGAGKIVFGALAMAANATLRRDGGDILTEILLCFPKGILGVSLFVCGVAFAQHALKSALSCTDDRQAPFVCMCTCACALKYKSAVALLVGGVAHTLLL